MLWSQKTKGGVSVLPLFLHWKVLWDTCAAQNGLAEMQLAFALQIPLDNKKRVQQWHITTCFPFHHLQVYRKPGMPDYITPNRDLMEGRQNQLCQPAVCLFARRPGLDGLRMHDWGVLVFRRVGVPSLQGLENSKHQDMIQAII
jgi:hypothetical protein